MHVCDHLGRGTERGLLGLVGAGADQGLDHRLVTTLHHHQERGYPMVVRRVDNRPTRCTLMHV